MSLRPETLGRYRLEQLLGHGGMAVVYRGHDEELDRVVAVKLLADNLARDTAFRQRFLREARLAARLSHPNIVHVYDTGEQAGRPYIVMEYIQGETLAELLARERRLEPTHALSLALQACAGLQHAHQAGLVHRDVKPQNLLLRPDGTLKLVDFGIARSARGTRLTEIGSILGTASYLAPEQAAGAEVTATADLYALGVVLYQMLSGQTPHSDETLTQLLVTQRQQPLPLLRERAPGVSLALEDVVMRCLARLPEHRPPSAAALACQLEATLPELPTRARDARQPSEAPTRLAPGATRPLLARPPSPAPQPPYRSNFLRLTRKHLAIAAAATAALVLLALVIALTSGGHSNSGSDGGAPPPSPVSNPPLQQAHDLSNWLRAHTR